MKPEEINQMKLKPGLRLKLTTPSLTYDGTLLSLASDMLEVALTHGGKAYVKIGQVQAITVFEGR
jgi:hypothetical protein